MSEAILCPQVGQDLIEAKVVALHVKLGDTVKKGMIVAEVESEKATFEVEAFAAGVVVKLPYQVGETATVLEPLVVLSGDSDAKSAAKQHANAPAKNGNAAAQHEVVALAPSRGAMNGQGRSSPLARRMAQNNSLEIDRIAGTGPHGAVVSRDVEALVAKSGKSAIASATELHVKSLKDGKGTSVAFIHGFGAEIAAWRQIAMAIDLPNTLLAIDLPGHGASPDAATPGFQSIVDAVALTLRSMGNEFHLVGHSLGAAVAIAVSAQTGLIIKSLTLFAPAGMGTTVDGDFVAGFLAAKSEVALAAQMKKLVNDPADLPTSMVKATQAAREAGPVTERQAKVAAGLFEGSTQLFSVRAELAKYQGPCRIILGQKDGIISPSETDRKLPAGIAVHRLENAGHLPFLEEQGLSARLIAETVRSSG
jgi:pimeloyl-ACP methyl ester carboxylesterase